MRVLSVTPAAKRRCKVLLEEDFAFVLYEGELAEYGIQEGAELEEETLERLGEVLMARAKERALSLLQKQGRTKRQLEERLASDGYPAQVRERVMKFLEEYRLVDDKGFACSYIRLHGGRKSRRQLLYELQGKGVSQEVLEEALETTPIDEEASARTFVSRRLRGKAVLSWEEKGKLSAAMSRKGYSFSLIRRLLDEWEEGESIGINRQSTEE